MVYNRMKRFSKIVLALTLISSSLFSGGDHKELRLKIMHTYAGALHEVQDGFLYNSKTKILNGAKTILKTSKEVQGHKAKEHLPKEQAYTYKFAQKITERISVHAENIIDATERGNTLEAIDEFDYVLKQCTSCHLRVRGW